ncbi:MAG TPA: nuclear transport factor 2 family protein [Alphaproteobacteria bacterium]|nr:nuclear transport factor 2 family protein [Alphaproteobacteria bacterium]
MLADAYKKWKELVPAHERSRESLEEKVQFVADKQRIGEMIHEYAFACDSRNWDALREIYDENIERIMHGTLNEQVRGKEQLIALHANPALPRAQGVEMEKRDLTQFKGLEIRHLIGTQMVRIGDDNRTAWALCHYQMALVGQLNDAWEHGLHEGTYLFSFSKASGQWKFVRHLIWTNNAANPMFGVPKKKQG